MSGGASQKYLHYFTTCLVGAVSGYYIFNEPLKRFASERQQSVDAKSTSDISATTTTPRPAAAKATSSK
jgi:hypothetical protein